MVRRLLPFAVTAVLLCPTTLLCPINVFAQTPPAAPVAPAPPAAPAPPSTSPDPTAPTPAKKPHVNGKITAVDAAAKTITLNRGKRTVVLSVPDTTKIYKIGDEKGSPTGTFADLVIDTRINAAIEGASDAPVAKTIHIRAPKTTGAPAPAPAAPAL